MTRCGDESFRKEAEEEVRFIIANSGTSSVSPYITIKFYTSVSVLVPGRHHKLCKGYCKVIYQSKILRIYMSQELLRWKLSGLGKSTLGFVLNPLFEEFTNHSAFEYPILKLQYGILENISRTLRLEV